MYVCSKQKKGGCSHSFKEGKKEDVTCEFYFLILPKNPFFLSFSTTPELTEAFDPSAGEDMGLRPWVGGAGEGVGRRLDALNGGR